jgi:hypothetical protein
MLRSQATIVGRNQSRASAVVAMRWLHTANPPNQHPPNQQVPIPENQAYNYTKTARDGLSHADKAQSIKEFRRDDQGAADEHISDADKAAELAMGHSQHRH